jgi:adenylate kinase
MRLVMIGAPGSGKGTQSVRICQYFKIPHLSTGDIFRTHIQLKTEIGIKVEEMIRRGQLVPDEITMEIVKQKLEDAECKNGFLMDGFPRTAKQAKFLENLLKEKSYQIDYAINLMVDDSVIVHRMSGRRVCPKCGASYHLSNIPPKATGTCDVCQTSLIQRQDDDEQTVIQRLDVYHMQAGPIIAYYRKKGILLEIKGKASVEETAVDIFRNLGVYHDSY